MMTSRVELSRSRAQVVPRCKLTTMSKRTLDTFFTPKTSNKKKKLTEETSHHMHVGPPSTHPTYPFPVPQLPDTLSEALSSSPTNAGRVINDQPDLNLIYFEPYFSASVAKNLFEFLRRELFFYRVVYKINRFGKETEVNTPRL